MSKTLIPALAGVGAAGLGGGIYLAHKNSENPSPERKTILLRLEKEKYKPLKLDDPTHWQDSLTNYKKQHTQKTSYTEQELKNLCSSLFKRDDIREEDYSTAKRCCVVPRTISQRLEDLGFKVIEASETEKWKKLSGEYKASGTGNKKLGDLVNTAVDDESTGEKLKKKCQEVLAKGHWENNYDSLLEGSKTWCTDKALPPLQDV
ncbi:hypothetical protein HF1_09130 [Mycoplasma haemofelis str. Langford 1]|uniref:Uncharacterized protein n=1 Tax=Mycoplasma haemofelis (strain Langford 1) TaxID=941640 RepID=E8ZIF0_MYCHL|nr:hypothetical protein [Mycoplasma haemofelis]CBY92921.1 hypothetical protein HF1_09130 [Mycoplasma haemofelis str. Langford 1]